MKSNINVFLGTAEESIKTALENLAKGKIIERIWQKDHTVWKKDPQEIHNRLDWLTIVEEIEPQIGTLQEFALELHQEGFQQAFLLGMGGSSLAPELFARVLPRRSNALELLVLDTTDAETISRYTQIANQKKTLYIVSTKSGNTLETLMLFRHFFALVQRKGGESAGQYFVAITDPGSPLVDLAQQHRFRKVFLNNPNIGGRYSAFSLFGLVPASLTGVNLHRLLNSAKEGMQQCLPNLSLEENYGALLGSMMGVLAEKGQNKPTFFFSPQQWKSFGDWLEQLIAESTGKEGKGILPVIEHAPCPIHQYGEDRWFVMIGDTQNPFMEQLSQEMRKANCPFFHAELPDPHTLGEQMFLWEFATAVAGYFLGINPFDQPNVEETKILTKKRIHNTQTLPDRGALLLNEAITVIPDHSASSPQEAFFNLFLQLPQNGYIALQAFLPYRKQIEDELWKIASTLRDRIRRAVTVGFGPRFLHSTGQLHKGDDGKGIFIQFLSENPSPLPIPGEPFDFDFLKKAQAFGDREALQNRGRQVITCIVKEPIPESLATIRAIFEHLPLTEC
ncbi:MAG: hypothetical protein ABDK94_06065 [Atribacterota bacterium]